jgi:division protein CdvB (Snf7/Vps24/ESCRT-III family)
MQSSLRAWGIRVATVVIAVLTVREAVQAAVPKVLPDYALGNLWILRGERALAILLLLVILLTVIWRGVIEGQLPLEISREGLKYEAAKALIQKGTETATGAVAEEINKALGEFKSDLAKVSEAVDNTAGATAEAIRLLEAKIEAIEGELNE